MRGKMEEGKWKSVPLAAVLAAKSPETYTRFDWAAAGTEATDITASITKVFRILPPHGEAHNQGGSAQP